MFEIEDCVCLMEIVLTAMVVWRIGYAFQSKWQ